MCSGGENMKKQNEKRGFIFSLLLSMLFNLEWTVPAWIFLALHFLKGFSLWWFIVSIILWVVFIVLRVTVFSSLTRAGSYKDPPKENKNPYSKSDTKK